MKHKSSPSNYGPDSATKTQLDAIGLGDPSVALRERAVRDLFIVGLIYVFGLLFALATDLGETIHDFAREHEYWEIDEFIAAALLSLLVFVWFSWRQWFRYSNEVTRRLKLEENVVEMRLMTDQLGERKAVFLADLAHDLRSPLNSILGFSQFLRDEPFGPLGNERYRTYIKAIHDSAVTLNERIDSCLDPDKIEFGAEPMQMMPYPLKNAVNAAVPILEPIARNAGITLRDNVADDLPDIHGDSRALRKIIVILAMNAIKHGRPNGLVSISAATTPEKALTLTVEDDGIGMDKRQVAALIGPNYGFSDAAWDGEHDSVSLAVKKLLELHDATIKVDSYPNSGRTVTVTFPPERVVSR